MTEAERAVIETAMFEYRRLRRLGWNATYFDGTARKHWIACRKLQAQIVRRTSTRSDK